MKPNSKSYKRLGIAQSKAKMYEYHIDEKHHISISEHPRDLFPFTIGMIGDITDLYSDNPEDEIDNLIAENLIFSARFFDSYKQAKFNSLLDNDLLLLGAAAYYLGKLQGSSSVLLNSIQSEAISENSLKFFLYSLLKGDDKISPEKFLLLSLPWEYWTEFLRNGESYDLAMQQLQEIRNTIYSGTDNESLFFIDLIIAVMGRKKNNSSWISLEKYSDLSREIWRSTITKDGFTKELWPSQHLLGQHGILKGKSAVIQMPTSAGKTKSAEIIIRSSFLSGRSDKALIVAPFRALCHEIRNDLSNAFSGEDIKISEISDVLQTDIDIFDLFENTHKQKKILVLTPEKLLYILRQEQASDFLNKIGLIIFDEGHQFDNGSRGITYELLLTSLKKTLPENTQKILISAVIGNADDIGRWLNGEENETIKGNQLTPTYKTVGFASWIDSLGQIKFVNNSNIEEEDFFVPRVLQKEVLEKLPRERKQRSFPDKEDGMSVALYLGLKLVSNGGVAIFCGNKDTPNTITKKLIDLSKRNYNSSFPYEFSDPIETQRLKNLISLNLGENSLPYKAAALGVFLHHSSSPQGMRIAIESAMREGDISFIICTSTLAQGVNLPIKYLIVTSIYQGGEKLKNRDFHNLIGRVGRAGKYTEGSVLFSDPEIFDERRRNSWRWKNIKNLMNANNSEDCTSTLLSIFDPLLSDDEKAVYEIEFIDFLKAYFTNKSYLEEFAEKVEKTNLYKKFTAKSISSQIKKKLTLIDSIQGFLMAHLNNDEEINKEKANFLCEQTLAYHLANDEIKSKLKTLFESIADDLNFKTSQKSRKSYSQTLLGLEFSKNMEIWLKENVRSIIESEDDTSLLSAVWPAMIEYTTNKTISSCNNFNQLLIATYSWILGRSYQEIHGLFNSLEIKRKWGDEQFRDYSIDHVVEIFEQGISHDGGLVLSAISSLLSGLSDDLLSDEEKIILLERLHLLQKKIKYGLSTKEEISIYEAGFCDRVIASRIYGITGNFSGDVDKAKHFIKEKILDVREALDDMPKYYQTLLKSI